MRYKNKKGESVIQIYNNIRQVRVNFCRRCNEDHKIPKRDTVIDKHFTLDEPVTNGKKIKQINNVKTLLHISDINFLWYYAHKRRTMQESTTTITPSRELWGSRLTLTVTLALTLIYYSSLVRTNASEPIDEPDI